MVLTARDIARLKILSYPDPILRKKCRPIAEFGGHLPALAEKMWSLMHDHRGVGLAGPQVGLPWRIFVWNPTGEPGDDRIVFNPKLDKFLGQEEAEEGCLSIEKVHVVVKRAKSVELTGQDVTGRPFTLSGEDLLARIWQHENDHLDGRMIIDYQSGAEEIANRRALKDLEARVPRAKRTAQRR
jgi:peptide deformylase